METATALLARLPLSGRLLTGDALYCQRQLCEQVARQGGDYLFTVKGNQPTLRADLELLFAAPPPGTDLRMASRRERRRGQTEVRQLWVLDAPSDYLGWPHARQVLMLQRSVEGVPEEAGAETRYGITSLGPETSPATLLARWRGHWAIENRLHWVRDVIFGEDASRVRSGDAPQVMAALRNVVLRLVRNAGHLNVASALRSFAWQPRAPLSLLGIIP